MQVPVVVETTIPATSSAIEIGPDGYALESYKQIDHANSSDRKWLQSHCSWAVRNGRKVSIRPL